MLDDTLERKVADAVGEAKGLLRWVERLGEVAIEERDKAIDAGGLTKAKAEIERIRLRNRVLKSERDSMRQERDHLQELWDGAEAIEDARDDALEEAGRLRAAIEEVRDGNADLLFRTWAKGVLRAPEQSERIEQAPND
jgi:hypothetical protein